MRRSGLASVAIGAQEPVWNPSAIKSCETAMFKHDPKGVPPLSIDYRMTGNLVTMRRSRFAAA